MGATENKIFETEILALETEIRQALNGGTGEPVPAPDNVPNILAIFNLEQASSQLKLKIFKKKLEAIIVTFERYADLEEFPNDSVRSIKDALNHIIIGFYSVLEDSSMEITTTKGLKGILKSLLKAQSYATEATKLFGIISYDDEEKIRWSDYNTALQDCRNQMFEIRRLLKGLKLETNAK